MKKLRWAILALSVILCVAVVVNWDRIAASNNKEAENTIGGETYVSGENYFESARYSRDQVRAETVSALKEILNNEKTEENARLSAEEDISQYAKASETESKIENLIIAKGFSDCVAFVGEDNVSIVVENTLTSEDAAKIIDIATGETGFPSSVIKIIELNSDSGEKDKENSGEKDKENSGENGNSSAKD